MQVEGTREAFLSLISQRGVYKLLDVEPSTVSTWKIYLREGKSISLDKMEEMLLKSGASVIQDKVWDVHLDRSMQYAMKMRKAFKIIETMKEGDTIQLNYRGELNELAIKAEITNRAKRLGLKVFIDEEHRPVVKYTLCKLPITEPLLRGFGLDRQFEDAKGNFFKFVEVYDDESEQVLWRFYRNNEPLGDFKYYHQLNNLYLALTGEELSTKIIER